MDDQPISATVVSIAPADAGLHCPQCDYNLTGLPEPRCPECGASFDWEQVRRAAADRPRIFFERVRGWRKVPGFFATWATVLFSPWIFARQAVARMSTGHALVFALVCFAGTFAAMLSGADMQFMLTWLTTAFFYIFLQAMLFGILDFSGWRQPLRSLRFWLLVGCYTSAVMLSEGVYAGPPAVALRDLRDLLRGAKPTSWYPEMYVLSFLGGVSWARLVLWLGGLLCCYLARLRRRPRPLAVIVAATVLAALGVVGLYAVTYEYVGVPLSGWYGV